MALSKPRSPSGSPLVALRRPDVATMPRSLRIPDELWRAAVAKAASEGTTVTAVVVAALTRYVNRKARS